MSCIVSYFLRTNNALTDAGFVLTHRYGCSYDVQRRTLKKQKLVTEDVRQQLHHLEVGLLGCYIT